VTDLYASRVDAHLHLWDREVSEYAWLGPQHGELFASWLPEQVEPELSAAGITGAVLVQAEDSIADTAYLLGVADRFEWAIGVVGWIPFESPVAAGELLDVCADNPALCGVRNLLDDDPHDGILDLPAVRETLADVARRNIAFDVHNAWPRHFGEASRLAADLPELRIVLDHLGKPPRGTESFSSWRDALTELAGHPNVVAKLSGLGVGDQPFSVDALRETWDVALETFGPSRLMYGGDWPITVPAGGYQATFAVLSSLIGELSDTEQADIYAGTAARAYNL
jgi:L-fuconolactonase